MDNRKATYPSNVRLSEFFLPLLQWQLNVSIKPANISSNDFKQRPKCPEIALALIYHEGFVFVWIITNDTSQVTWWKLMNHFMIV
jgi:hypothetical protein